MEPIRLDKEKLVLRFDGFVMAETKPCIRREVMSSSRYSR